MKTASGRELEQLAAAVKKPDGRAYGEAKRRLDAVAKPLDSLGVFEENIARIAGMTGSADVRLDSARVLVFCADNGVIAEGVSQSGADVTAAVAANIARGRGNINRLAGALDGVGVSAVDIGMASEPEGDGLLRCAVRRGTRNFLKEPAMTEEEAIRAIRVGMRLVGDAKADGVRVCLTGEMGIGNTTTSGALAAVLLGEPVRAVTGRGAGLTDAGLERKIAVIGEAIEKYGFRNPQERETADDDGRRSAQDAVFRLLCTLGGLDIAGLVGVCLGGAACGVPVLLDGVIALVAALIAERLFPGTRDYLLAGHEGKEPACRLLLQALDLRAPIRAELALGEGSGAVMALALYRMALAVYRGDTFDRIGVEAYQHYGQEERGEVPGGG